MAAFLANVCKNQCFYNTKKNESKFNLGLCFLYV